MWVIVQFLPLDAQLMNDFHLRTHNLAYNPLYPIIRGSDNEKPRLSGVRGVDNAARTRDLLNHNQLLYRLSYIHHVWVRFPGFAQQMDTIQDFRDNASSARREHEFPVFGYPESASLRSICA